MLRINQTTTDQDLALALEDEHGTFLAQKGGQCFVVVAQEGHSIASLRSVGRQFVEAAPTAGEQPWFITKISNSTEALTEQPGYSREKRRERIEQRV